jgi:putative addiction module component (TIGR02574 family)
MSARSVQILEEALSLSAKERAELAEKILSSLEFSPNDKIDSLWASEAEERLDAFHRDEIPTVPAREVFENITKRKTK